MEYDVSACEIVNEQKGRKNKQTREDVYERDELKPKKYAIKQNRLRDF